MKKILFAMGVMLAATFTLTNCTKELQNPQDVKTPYTIYANTAATKTANDGLSTVWVDGDALTVFATAAGSTEYGTSSKFTLTDAASGKFETDDLKADLAATNDWYALYPYSSYVTTPASTDAGYINVGAVSIQQKGYDNMEHLSGTNCPLYGVAKGVSAQTLPDLTMKHLTSVIKIEVTNNAGAPMTISTVAFTANENIVGTYYVNFAGNEVVYTGSGEKYVSATATLTVTDAPELLAGKTATFYIPVKPFTATAGTDLVLSVNGEDKTLTLPKNVSFAAGAIKTLKYSVDKVVEQEVLSISEVIAAEDKAQVLTAGLVVGTYARGVLIQDETGYLLVYDGAKAPAKVGDMIEVSGAKATYGGLAQIGSPVVTVKSSDNKVTRPAAVVLDGAAMDKQLSATAVSYIEYTGTLAVSGSYYNVTVDGTATAIGSLSYPDSSLGLKDLNGKTIKVTGYFVGVSSNKYVNTMVVAVEEISTGEEPEPEPGTGELTHPLTSNLVWTVNGDTKSYSEKVIVNGNDEVPALKLGTSSVVGVATITIPAGTTKVGYYGVAWKGKSGTITASSVAYPANNGQFYTQDLKANEGIHDNSPYTLTSSDADYYEIDVVSILGAAAPSDIPVTLSTVSGATRVVIWGLNYYTASGIGSDQSGSEPEPEPEPEPTPGAPASLITATVAEFLAAAESTDTWYKLTGEIVSIAKADYGNFTIKDETGEVYIYGMTNGWVGSNDKSFSAIGLKVGDIVTLGTLRGSHNGTPQGGGNTVPAYYISHVEGETPEVTVEGSGTEADPYTVADVIALHNSGAAPTDAVWIEGDIVGYYNSNTSKFCAGTEGAVASNLAIGTSDVNIPVQLPSGDIRKALNLADNPGNLGKTVAICGKIQAYFSVAGIKSPTDYKLN